MFFLNIMSDNVEIECVDLFSDDSDDEYIVLEDSVYSSEGFIEGKVHFQILRQEESLAGWEVRLFFNILFSFFLFLGKNCHPLPPYTASIPSVHLNRFKLVLLSLHLQPRWHNHCCLLRPYVTQSSCSRFVWHRDTTFHHVWCATKQPTASCDEIRESKKNHLFFQAVSKPGEIFLFFIHDA